MCMTLAMSPVWAAPGAAAAASWVTALRPGSRSLIRKTPGRRTATTMATAAAAQTTGRKTRSMPQEMIYGTAWKKEATEELVVQAVAAGFRGVDTACQPKHYREDLVGAAVARLVSMSKEEGGVPREELYLQTKFTSLDGQDVRKPIPYDAAAPVQEQVRQSIAASLANLRTDYLDAVLLHSPLRTEAATVAAWAALEEEVAAGRILRLGISNIYDVRLLRRLHDSAARVKPSLVQNRFYQATAWDKDVRQFCADHGMAYQSFWTLTGNPDILASRALNQAAAARGWTPAQAMYKFVQQLGVTPLNGTTNKAHMAQDLAVAAGSDLTQEELAALKALINEQ